MLILLDYYPLKYTEIGVITQLMAYVIIWLLLLNSGAVHIKNILH